MKKKISPDERKERYIFEREPTQYNRVREYVGELSEGVNDNVDKRVPSNAELLNNVEQHSKCPSDAV